MTALASAIALDGWRGIGVNPSFDHYPLYDLLRILLPLLPAGGNGELAEVEHQGRAWHSICSGLHVL